MTRQERATQIWPILTFCASQRHLMSYEELSGLITVLLPGLGQLLEPIQKYCVKHQLPPLTSIVVSRTNGIPGEGFIAAENVPEAQANTFSHNWIQEHCPMPEEF